MKKLARSVLTAFAVIALIAIAMPSSAAGRGDVDSKTGVYFAWMAGAGDFNETTGGSSSNYVFVDVRAHKNLSLEGGYISFAGPGNEGLHLGISPVYEASDKLDLTLHLGHGFTDEPSGGLEGNWLTYGAGFIYDLKKNYFGLRGRWQRLRDQGDVYWLGLHWHLHGFARNH